MANSNEEIKELEKIINLAKLNGITDLQEIDSKKLKIIEPNINGKSGILSPSSGIFDSYDFMQKLFWGILYDKTAKKIGFWSCITFLKPF